MNIVSIITETRNIFKYFSPMILVNIPNKFDLMTSIKMSPLRKRCTTRECSDYRTRNETTYIFVFKYSFNSIILGPSRNRKKTFTTTNIMHFFLFLVIFIRSMGDNIYIYTFGLTSFKSRVFVSVCLKCLTRPPLKLCQPEF